MAAAWEQMLARLHRPGQVRDVMAGVVRRALRRDMPWMYPGGEPPEAQTDDGADR